MDNSIFPPHGYIRGGDTLPLLSLWISLILLMMLWQAAQVDSDGTHLAYLDSGVPQTSDYTTFVIVHGHTFHAPVFTRLFALASEHNARIIALNRRDYVNSTPLSEADLDILAGNNESSHTEYLCSRGLEIARFLCWVITELKIPQSGNLSLLGWSLGNLFTIAFLANLDTYPSKIVQTLEPYLTSHFIYAPPYMMLGYPNPPDAYNPFYVPENPKHLAPITFGAWVSQYYKHPAYSSSQPSSALTPASFIQHTPEQPYRPCTTATMSSDELSQLLDLIPDARSEHFYFDMAPSMLHLVMEKALLGADKRQLPSVNINFVWGLEDVWVITWASCEFEKDLAQWRTSGERVRPTKVIPVPGANHFMHWDDAGSFLKLLKKHA